MAMLKIEFHIQRIRSLCAQGAYASRGYQKLPPESRMYIFEYGLQRALNDCVGAIKARGFRPRGVARRMQGDGGKTARRVL